MSVYDLRTVSTAKALPPKPVAKIKVPLSEAYLAELMAKEAKAVRARMSRAYGAFNSQAGGEEANLRRQQQAVAEREDLAMRALALITSRPRSSAELREHFRVTENKMRASLGLLKHRGLVESKRQGCWTVWQRKVEAAE